jgi:hypothetical protein
MMREPRRNIKANGEVSLLINVCASIIFEGPSIVIIFRVIKDLESQVWFFIQKSTAFLD